MRPLSSVLSCLPKMSNTEQTPVLTIHKADARGNGEYGWLSTHYSFSFANWYDPTRMGFGALRVLNDDTIANNSGFGTHGHNNMEIITIVTEGKLAHKDSMGSVGLLSEGEVQVMSAGVGITHSEYNGGEGDLKLFQIWIIPDQMNITPRYDQRLFPKTEHGETLLVAPQGHQDALTINQNAYISSITLDAGHPFEYKVKKNGHGVYFFIVDGEATIAGITLGPRDAIGVEQAESISLQTGDKAEVLAIEVPMQ